MTAPKGAPTPKRPTLARKVTPASEKARTAPFDQGIKIAYEGKEYVVRSGDLNALDAQALRQQLGLSFIGLINGLGTDPDIDLIAGVVWMARRINGEPGLPYAAVASAMRYDALDGLDLERIEDAEEPSPEG